MRSTSPERADERGCLYTVLLGGYEELTEQPVAHGSGFDFVCLTDDPTLESDTWTVRLVQPRFADDATRSQRLLKIRAHATVPDYAVSVYVDNSILLRQPPELLVAELLPDDVGLAVMAHGFRATVADEFAEVVALGLDAHDRCAEQEHHYRARDPESLDLRPLKAGLLLRRHHQPLVVAAMESWAAHVLRYSRRDQLSFWFCLREAGLAPLVHELDNFESPYHRWPVSVGRAPVDRLWPDPRLELARVRDRLDSLEASIDAQRSTRSWRWTEPARRLRRAFP
jgi:hypothetical protein